MHLAPIHRQGELQVGAGRPEHHIKPQRRATTEPPPDEAHAQRSGFGQFGRPLPAQGQGLAAVVGGQVPGIPKLAPVGPAAPLQGRGQLGQAIESPELLHANGPDQGGDQAIAEAPAAARRGGRPRPWALAAGQNRPSLRIGSHRFGLRNQAHRLLHRQGSSLGWRRQLQGRRGPCFRNGSRSPIRPWPRRARGARTSPGSPPISGWQGLAPQGQVADPGGQGHLQPLAAARGRLAQQGLSAEGPVADRQPQGQGGRRQGLELH